MLRTASIKMIGKIEYQGVAKPHLDIQFFPPLPMVRNMS
jgi:hypothetical protein